MKNDLRLIVLENCKELGERINKHLNELRGTNVDYRVPIENSRFSNGEGKIKILESVREKDLYVISDCGNYDMTFNMHGRVHYMSPDEHMSDVKRTIAASSDHARRVSLLMPLLYESRQHKRKGRESLDCALGLQEIQNLGIKNMITFDAHDPNVANAVPRMSFENFYPTNIILEEMFRTEDMNNLLVIAPDLGAMERARFYAEMIGSDVGCFYKRRDLSKIIDGKNPIVEHLYLGPDVQDKNIIIVDDMIASGGSVLEVAEALKERGANNVYICVTFALFTEGIDRFEEAYQKGCFDRIYSTNVTYVPDNVKKKTWYHDVDCSHMIARIINALNKGESLEVIHNEGKQAYKTIRDIQHPMKIGIFGGSFNPPHKFHETIAHHLVNDKYLDKVIFVPTGSKYEYKHDLLPDEIRLKMINLMIKDTPYLESDNFEQKNRQVYTYQTLSHFKKKYPNDEIYFICGSDNLAYIDEWKNGLKLLQKYKFLVLKRRTDDIKKLLNKYKEYQDNIIVVNLEENDLSSTYIRDNITEEDVKHCLNEDVYSFIIENNLYQGDQDDGI